LTIEYSDLRCVGIGSGLYFQSLVVVLVVPSFLSVMPLAMLVVVVMEVVVKMLVVAAMGVVVEEIVVALGIRLAVVDKQVVFVEMVASGIAAVVAAVVAVVDDVELMASGIDAVVAVVDDVELMASGIAAVVDDAVADIDVVDADIYLLGNLMKELLEYQQYVLAADFAWCFLMVHHVIFQIVHHLL